MKKRTAKEIWVYGDLRNERLFGLSLKVLAKARVLSESCSGKAAMVLLGSSDLSDNEESVLLKETIALQDASRQSMAHGADFVYVLDDKKMMPPRADVYAKPLAETIQSRAPMLMLFPVTDFGKELAARAARINNAGLIAECLDIQMDNDKVVAKCPSWGGRIMADNTFSDTSGTGYATVMPHAFQEVEAKGDPGIEKAIAIGPVEVPGNIKLLSRTKEPFEEKNLEDADFVVVGGAGLGNAENFGLVRELATALGGEVGATRPPVLLHWVDEERLIGQTGKTVRPRLLISIGTSGAVQYTAGIAEADTIVAINRDQNAPMFEVADYGVVADAKTFLPLFVDKVKQATMRKLADALKDSEDAGAGESFGAKVRKLREAQDWSLESLAGATGESPEFLEKVEQGDMTPPVGFLLRLAGALKIDPATFLSREDKALIRDMRAQAFTKRTQDYSYQTLSPGAENDHLRAFMITIEPKQTHKPVAYKHEGEEFIFVMEGDLQLTVASKTHHLRPGESTHFNSDTPHKLKSISDDQTRCLVVLYTP
ncbi:MAG: FAD-binding protein [Deltaproteobacteria bacterium]|nr:FAD-binding protein [Deltaproteobacteria bacterium]